AARAGASVISQDELARRADRDAVIVPPDRLIDRSNFPPSSSDSLLDISTAAARARTTWSILQRTGKPTDGWVARHWNRPISRVVSFVLLSAGLKASHASLITL